MLYDNVNTIGCLVWPTSLFGDLIDEFVASNCIRTIGGIINSISVNVFSFDTYDFGCFIK